MINFVSNLPADLCSGGFSAMNAAALEALRKHYPVNYAGPINPPMATSRRVLSKLKRTAGMAGDFPIFSRSRLARIAAEVQDRCRHDGFADFFHGFTPWSGTRPTRPYIAWGDCTFRDYISIYHRRRDFLETDLTRIEVAEAAWMRGAQMLGFTSAWAAERAVADYGLDPNKVVVVGIFGELEPPKVDSYAGEKQFAFVSTNFAAKGGAVVLEAFRKVSQLHTDARLAIVGDAPRDIEKLPNIFVAGFLHKENPQDRLKFRGILGSSRAVVHPTRSDISPLLAVEAGYFGCPVISTRRFAIPEIVQDGITGVLLDDPTDAAKVAEAMIWMLEAECQVYTKMRNAAWTHTRQMHSKIQFEERLLGCVQVVIPGALTGVKERRLLPKYQEKKGFVR